MKLGNKTRIQVFLTQKQLDATKKMMIQMDFTRAEAIRRILDDYILSQEKRNDS